MWLLIANDDSKNYQFNDDLFKHQYPCKINLFLGYHYGLIALLSLNLVYRTEKLLLSFNLFFSFHVSTMITIYNLSSHVSTMIIIYVFHLTFWLTMINFQLLTKKTLETRDNGKHCRVYDHWTLENSTTWEGFSPSFLHSRWLFFDLERESLHIRVVSKQERTFLAGKLYGQRVPKQDSQNLCLNIYNWNTSIFFFHFFKKFLF